MDVIPETKPCRHCEGEMVKLSLKANGLKRFLWRCLSCRTEEPTQEDVTREWGEA